jgi:Fic family protein
MESEFKHVTVASYSISMNTSQKLASDDLEGLVELGCLSKISHDGKIIYTKLWV